MQSPITAKEMQPAKEKARATFRNEAFEYTHHYYLCTDSGERFTDDRLDELNTNQVYNQYRERHHMPYPEEIKAIRAKYELPASKMAEILGFGANMYRNYENGEIPSASNARLIQLAQDAKEFKRLVLPNGNMPEKLLRKLDTLIAEVDCRQKQKEMLHTAEEAPLR